jgi:putative flippase GtrA
MLKRLAQHPRLKLFWLLSRFGLAGALNTIVGLSVISALDLGAHVDPHLANAAGYAVGLTVGFTLNRRYVFRSDGCVRTAGLRYAVTVAIGFAINQLVLMEAGLLYGAMPLARLAAQLTAMASYTVVVFTLCRLWVFRPQSPSLAASASAAGQAASNT